MEKQKFTIGAFVMVFNEEKKVLLCHRRDYDLWNLPGGMVENGETPWEAVIREAKEETGFDIELVKLQGVYSKPEKNDIVFSFVGKIINGKKKLNEEANKIEYFAFEDLPNNIVLKQKERIQDFLDNQQELVMKAQKGESSIDLIKRGRL